MKEILKAEVKCFKKSDGTCKVEVSRQALRRYAGRRVIVKIFTK